MYNIKAFPFIRNRLVPLKDEEYLELFLRHGDCVLLDFEIPDYHETFNGFPIFYTATLNLTGFDTPVLSTSKEPTDRDTVIPISNGEILFNIGRVKRGERFKMCFNAIWKLTPDDEEYKKPPNFDNYKDNIVKLSKERFDEISKLVGLENSFVVLDVTTPDHFYNITEGVLFTFDSYSTHLVNFKTGKILSTAFKFSGKIEGPMSVGVYTF